MAWNKNTYYYQNQMKALSGSDPEPGYKEDDDPVAAPENLDERIEQNGLYRFVSLIKDKIDKIWEAIFGAWRLEKEENNLNDLSNPYLEDGEVDLDKIVKVGNYGYYAGSNNNGVIIKNAPKTAAPETAFTLKVSRVKEAETHVWQNFVLRNGHQWYRYGLDSDRDGIWTWGPWMLVLTHEENDTDNPVNQNDGTADDLFLKRKNDFTNGPIGFGKDPSQNGIDYSKKGEGGVPEEQWVKAKIVLGEYTYGPEKPSAHYAKPEFLDSAIPKGQIYLEYYPDSTED